MTQNCPNPDLHGNPFRYCPSCTWIEPAPNENYTKAESANTPMMTTAAILQWIDMEIEDVKARPQPNPASRLVVTGIVLYLEVMKEKLSNEALNQLDKING